MERRTFLVLGVSLIGVAACTADPDVPDPTPTPSPPPARDPDAGLRDRVAAAEIDLIQRYRSVIADHPELAESIGPFLAHHEAHLQRVAPGAAVPPATTPPATTPSASGSAAAPAPGDASASGGAAVSAAPSTTQDPPASAEPSASAPASSPAPSEGLGALAAMEQDAHRARLSDCDAASSGVLARDLCQIAASEAQHAAVLGRLRRGERP